MDSPFSETSREKLVAWLRYYDDLNLGEFFIDRRVMGKRAVEPPVVRSQATVPAATPVTMPVATPSAIRNALPALLPVVQAASLFEAIDRVEGDTLELIRENLGECTRS